MKDEIKEILKNMKEWSVDGNLYFEINDEKAKLLYDYITNLEEKYERMKENAEILSNGYNELEKRIDKANEIIDEVLFVGVKNYRSQLEIIQKVINGGDE